MSKLEELVPPLELCKLIPKGEFEDTWAVRIQITTEIDDVVLGKWTTRENISTTQVVPRKYALTIINDLPDYEGYKLIPAPTLQEIMANIPYSVCQRIHDKWRVDSYTSFRTTEKYDQNATTAALKLWLQSKGIDYEK